MRWKSKRYTIFFFEVCTKLISVSVSIWLNHIRACQRVFIELQNVHTKREQTKNSTRKLNYFFFVGKFAFQPILNEMKKCARQPPEDNRNGIIFVGVSSNLWIWDANQMCVCVLIPNKVFFSFFQELLLLCNGKKLRVASADTQNRVRSLPNF